MNAPPLHSRTSPPHPRSAPQRRLGSGYMLASLLVLAAGCVPSLHPVYTEDQLVFDKNLVGQWVASNVDVKWNFEKLDDHRYRLLYTDAKGQRGRFLACVASIDDADTRLLDLVPEAVQTPDEASVFYKLHLIPIHTVYLLRSVTESQVQLAAIDYKWLDQYLDQNPTAIEFMTINGHKVITAPTKDVQAFVLEHKDKFTQTIQLRRQ